MRLILMGTGPFAVPSFEQLAVDGHDIALVLCRPPVGDPAKQPPSPVRLWAESKGLDVAMPSSVNDPEVISQLQSLNADLLVVCDYGQILSADALRTSRLGGINLHGSLLPRYRGAAPVQWSVLSGDQVTGVSVIHMTPKLDAGPVIAVRRVEIGKHENAQELEKRLSEIGVAATIEAIEKLASCRSLEDAAPLGFVQDAALMTRAPRLSKADGQLDFRFSAELIDRQIRGLQPWPGAFGQLDLGGGKQLRVAVHTGQPLRLDARQQEAIGGMPSGKVLLGEPLKSIGLDASVAMVIVCGDGTLYDVWTLQPAGKRSMQSAEFARGYARNNDLQFPLPETPSSFLAKLQKICQPSGT